MTTYTSTGVGALLGVSHGRVLRVADLVGVGMLVGRRRLFTEGDVAVLRDRLGAAPKIGGFTQGQTLVLAELSRRPLGLRSARAVARACSLSPTTAARTVRSLVAAGLVVERDEVVALGRATRIRSVHVNVRHPQWGALLPTLRYVTPPVMPGPSPEAPLPRYLRHAFWNLDEVTYSRIAPATDGRFIAVRALTTGDPELLAYAVATVPLPAWGQAARTRGLNSGQRSLARNLGRSADG